MNIDPNQIVMWIGVYFLPFVRIGAFFATVPVAGNQLVPLRIRLLLALATTALLVPSLPGAAPAASLSAETFLSLAQQLTIGIALGFFVQMFFHIFVLAGQMIAMQMGLGFASMVDPTNGVSVAVVSQFYVIFVTLLFLAFNGHLVVFEVLAQSFVFIPIGGSGLSGEAMYGLAIAGSWMFASALLLALPAVTAILIVNFAFGVMTRAAPQLNIFSLGFPFTLIFGIFILWVALGGFMPQYQDLSAETFRMLRAMIGT
ncbi:MAG: flagellar type III secretion system protein FliR [Gammaproteobacteria bacterium]|nr:flagellar type III secretion system protein FliR [Gammaproteobacteria bacterium]NND39831.1 flagellar type III secretion system protein FliR [Pseudomonadales bacterium]MBT8150979.1 flagellar type III secretion system protein FliR [Gammaproteobacteria bacterium]NNL11334.1 flagellar type III secretion system protein FliR [Pseudomonadales bacterium]NNM11163.1 flagellar type III secretion system protein FliR [Pseudomonadales bacterium]